MPRSICTVDGCEKLVNGHGLCCTHYSRWVKHGDPLGGSRNHAPPSERFWRRVNKAGPDECWLWTGCPNNAGYGNFQPGGKGSPPVRAHRFACEEAHGPAPEGYVAMHSCDVRLCVNPAHLSWGTRKENQQDMHQKGRANKIMPKGEQHCHAVLNEYLVRYIRSCPEKTHADLARELSVAVSTVRYVRSGRGWKHVA